jgi:hypothetical protein
VDWRLDPRGEGRIPRHVCGIDRGGGVRGADALYAVAIEEEAGEGWTKAKGRDEGGWSRTKGTA